MGNDKDQEAPAARDATTPAPGEEAPLPRWEDPVGAGDPVALDPKVHEPLLTPEEVEELLKKK